MTTPWPNEAALSPEGASTSDESEKELTHIDYAKICLHDAQILMTYAIFLTSFVFLPLGLNIEMIVNFDEAEPARGYINIITSVLNALPIVVLVLSVCCWCFLLALGWTNYKASKTEYQRATTWPAAATRRLIVIAIILLFVSMVMSLQFGVGWLVRQEILPRDIREVTSMATNLTLAVMAVFIAFLRLQKGASLLNIGANKPS